MKLLVSVFTALIVAFLNGLIIAIIGAYNEKENALGFFLYALIMIFGNIIVPVFFIVCSYSVIKSKLFTPNKIISYLTQVAFIAIVSALALCFITIYSYFSYFSFSEMKFSDIKAKFNSEYSGYAPYVLLDSFLIPISYFLIDKKLMEIVSRPDK